MARKGLQKVCGVCVLVFAQIMKRGSLNHTKTKDPPLKAVNDGVIEPPCRGVAAQSSHRRNWKLET